MCRSAPGLWLERNGRLGAKDKRAQHEAQVVDSVPVHALLSHIGQPLERTQTRSLEEQAFHEPLQVVALKGLSESRPVLIDGQVVSVNVPVGSLSRELLS